MQNKQNKQKTKVFISRAIVNRYFNWINSYGRLRRHNFYLFANACEDENLPTLEVVKRLPLSTIIFI